MTVRIEARYDTRDPCPRSLTRRKHPVTPSTQTELLHTKSSELLWFRSDACAALSLCDVECSGCA